MTQRAWTLKKRHWDEMPQMLRKQHWMKSLLQQEGVSETRSHWKTVKRRTSHKQLTSLSRAPTRDTSKDCFAIFGEVRTHFAVTEGDYVEHKTLYEAKQGDNWDQWHREMKDEVKALQDNETWNLVRPPTDSDVIPGKRVYKVKLGPSGQVDKNKARYVAKGFKQVEGLDYFETFAPNYKPEAFRILLQLSAKQGHVMHQFDVKTAFLHSPIEEEVYLEQPQEFVKQGSDGEKLVCRLNKSIYGLKQAANNWYKEPGKLPTETGVHQNQEWPLLDRKSGDRGSHFYLGLGWRHPSGIKKHDSDLRCKKGTGSNISHGRQGEITLVSGSKNQTRRGQSHSRPRTLHRNNAWAVSNGSMQSLRNSSWFEFEFQTTQNGDEEVDQRIYRILVGSLLYLAKQKRQDIMFTVNILSRHMNAPTNQHWICGKRILRYLQCSKGLKLTYTKEASYDLVGESDADWSGDVNDRRSTTGYYFKLNGRGAALSWGVKKQTTVALFSSEAECQGMAAAAVQEALYLKQILEDFGIQQKLPLAIGEDSQSCIKLCRNPAMHKRSKHIETKFYFIQDKTEGGTISIHYVPTDKMAAKIFTISLPVSKVETVRTVLMGTDCTHSAQVSVGVLEHRSNYSLKLSEN